MFELEFVQLDRYGDNETLFIRISEICAIAQNSSPDIGRIEGTAIIYMNNGSGFAVNHSPQKIATMIIDKGVTQ